LLEISTKTNLKLSLKINLGHIKYYKEPVPEIIDPVFAKTSPERSFCMTENEHFGLVFVKTGSINSGTEVLAGLSILLK
jgi:hypothetical protein